MVENSTASTPRVVSVPTADGDMPAHLWLPPSGQGPGLVLLQEIFGVTPYIRRRAADLAALGYVVLAPEIYWRSADPGPFVGEGALAAGVAQLEHLDWDGAVLDSAAAYGVLVDRPEVTGPVGIIGFCFGGGLGFAATAHLEARGVDPALLVSYYGSALPGLVDVLTVTVPSLHHFGLSDSYIDGETVDRIITAVTAQPDVTAHTYEGADHAFDNDEFPMHHAAASAEAWGRTVHWLTDHLPVG